MTILKLALLGPAVFFALLGMCCVIGGAQRRTFETKTGTIIRIEEFRRYQRHAR